MNKILPTAAIVATISLGIAANTLAADNPGSYYVGIDLQNRSMKYNQDLGARFMKRHVPEIGLFFGVKFNKYFGLEVGYEFSKHSSSTGTIKSGEGKMLDVAPSQGPVINIFREHINTVKYRRNGLQLLLTGHIPVKNHQNISIFGAIGVIFNKIKYSQQHIEYAQEFQPGNPLYQRSIMYTKSYKLVARKTYAAPIIKAGIQFLVPNDKIGLRIFGSFLKDSRIFTNNTPGNKYFKIHPKNSIGYGIGIFYKI